MFSNFWLKKTHVLFVLHVRSHAHAGQTVSSSSCGRSSPWCARQRLIAIVRTTFTMSFIIAWQRWRWRPSPPTHQSRPLFLFCSCCFLLQIWTTSGRKMYLTIPHLSMLRSGSNIIDCNYRFCNWPVLFHWDRHGIASVSFQAVSIENNISAKYNRLFGCQLHA